MRHERCVRRTSSRAERMGAANNVVLKARLASGTLGHSSQARVGQARPACLPWFCR
jgi:hypothetical protein